MNGPVVTSYVDISGPAVTEPGRLPMCSLGYDLTKMFVESRNGPKEQHVGPVREPAELSVC